MIASLPAFARNNAPAEQDSLRVLELSELLTRETDPKAAQKLFEELSAICKARRWWDRQLSHGYQYMESVASREGPAHAIFVADQLIGATTRPLELPTRKLGEILHKKGVYHYMLYQYDDAQAAFEAAIEIRREFPAKDTLAHSLYNLAVVFRLKGNYHQAATLLMESISLQESLGQSELLAGAYVEYGIIRYFLDDFGVADEYMHIALDIYRDQLERAKKENKQSSLESSLWNMAYTYNNISALHHYKDDLPQAIEALEKAVAIYKELDSDYNLASAYENMGTLIRHTGDYRSALDQYKKAKLIADRIGDRQKKAGIYRNLGMLYRAMAGENQRPELYATAVTYFENSLTERRVQLNPAAYHPDYSEDYKFLGDIALAAGKYQEALSFYQIAIIQLSDDFRDEDFYTTPRLETFNSLDTRVRLLRVCHAKADAFMKWHQSGSDSDRELQKALENYLIADQLILAIRNAYESTDSKLFLQKEASQLYEHALAAAFELYDRSGEMAYAHYAFQFMENSKAVLLLAGLKDFKAKIAAKIPDMMLTKINNLKAEIEYRERQVAAARLSDDLLQLHREETKLPILRTEFQTIIRKLETGFPIYYREKYNLAVVPIDRLQAHLQESESSLVEYFIGEENTYIFFLSGSVATPRIFRIGIGEPKLRTLVNTMLKSIDSREAAFDPDRVADYQSSASELYQLLWKPIAQLVPDQGRVIVIPAAYLGYLPFEALLEQKETNQKFKNYHYLIRKHPLSYGYSATILIENLADQKAQENRRLNFVGIAPVFQDHPRFDKLSGTEVEEISRLMSGTSLMRAEATKAAFFRAVSKADIVHICTHALTRDDPFNAWMQLIDDSVNIAELDTMDLRIEMIVLSACQTGIGELEKGEGIMSLARSFAYSGCQSIVSSLWKVNAQSTPELMKSFYRHLAGELPKDISLQLAKRNYFENEAIDNGDAHPYFWSGFLQSGSREGIAIPRRPIWPRWSGSALILAMILLTVNRCFPALMQRKPANRLK